MKEGIGLLAAILGLTTAVIVLLAALNKTDTVEVPVIREIQVLQPSTSTQPTTTTETEPITETVLVPDLRGFTEADAGIALDDEGLGAEIGEAAGTELCVGLSSRPSGKHGPTRRDAASGRRHDSDSEPLRVRRRESSL